MRRFSQHIHFYTLLVLIILLWSGSLFSLFIRQESLSTTVAPASYNDTIPTTPLSSITVSQPDRSYQNRGPSFTKPYPITPFPVTTSKKNSADWQARSTADLNPDHCSQHYRFVTYDAHDAELNRCHHHRHPIHT
ncbi:hypothetical protein [Tengunoibacter tsumagoiensis]|uniref:Uncharacterized protein n=1 Tax=Tengunoibacter tsumagoiensis TaxID=2014871 RepID=A0A402A0Z0_9CHLR|nr:hypothetical protein [Tengunoibacter tsumagoiensis]GCE12745.1 hypothetical protein KTT_26040 [Tengunoibacter tsumagoiensis]